MGRRGNKPQPTRARTTTELLSSFSSGSSGTARSSKGWLKGSGLEPQAREGVTTSCPPGARGARPGSTVLAEQRFTANRAGCLELAGTRRCWCRRTNGLREEQIADGEELHGGEEAAVQTQAPEPLDYSRPTPDSNSNHLPLLLKRGQRGWTRALVLRQPKGAQRPCSSLSPTGHRPEHNGHQRFETGHGPPSWAQCRVVPVPSCCRSGGHRAGGHR